MRRLTPLLLAALTALSLSAAPAVAEPLVFVDRPLLLVGSASIRFSYDPGTDTITVWLDGDISRATQQAGTWTLAIAGARGTAPYTYTWQTTTALVDDHKVLVRRMAPTGALVVDWGYTGVGGYVVAHSTHAIAWTPTTGNQTAGVDPST